MSDTRNDLSLPEQEAGFLFRMEMAATNFILGYWKHLVAVIVVVLLAILIYGQYNSTYRRAQRAISAQISEAWAELPAQAVPGQLSEGDQATLRSVADELMTIGAEGKGTAAAEAYLKAAELYRLLDEPESQRAAFEGAVEHASGPLHYAARAGIANLEIEAGNGEAAVQIYRELFDTLEGYLAQDAAVSLGLAYEHLERPADARAIYTEFLGRWPDSARASDVRDRLEALERSDAAAAPAGDGGGADDQGAADDRGATGEAGVESPAGDEGSIGEEGGIDDPSEGLVQEPGGEQGEGATP